MTVAACAAAALASGRMVSTSGRSVNWNLPGELLVVRLDDCQSNVFTTSPAVTGTGTELENLNVEAEQSTFSQSGSAGTGKQVTGCFQPGSPGASVIAYVEPE